MENTKECVMCRGMSDSLKPCVFHTDCKMELIDVTTYSEFPTRNYIVGLEDEDAKCLRDS